MKRERASKMQNGRGDASDTALSSAAEMGRNGGGRGDASAAALSSAAEMGRNGCDDDGGGDEDLATVPLIGVAESMLAEFQRMHKTEPKGPDMEVAKDALIGSEMFVYSFVYKGKDRKISMPRVLLNAGREFQLGCVYGMLVQKLRPKMMVCNGCGKVSEPRYAFHKGVIYDTVRSSRRD